MKRYMCLIMVVLLFVTGCQVGENMYDNVRETSRETASSKDVLQETLPLPVNEEETQYLANTFVALGY